MKTYNTLMTGMEAAYLVTEEPKPHDYHFRFKDGVGHPDATDATVQSHEKGHDINMVYKGHHIRASAATKTGNDPSSGSSSGFFRTLHITKGKKFDPKKLAYSHGAGSLKVDPKAKEKNDKVKEILPHIRGVAEHLIRSADRELDKHLQSKTKTLKEEAEWEEFGGDEALSEAPETRMNGGRKYTYDSTDKSNDPYHVAKMHKQGKYSHAFALKTLKGMGASDSFVDRHITPHKEEGAKNHKEYSAKMAKYSTLKEDSEDNEQEVPMYNKNVSNNYLKMYFNGSATKATTVLNKIKKDGKLKSFNIMGNLLIVQFFASERHDDLVMQDLSEVGVMDRGDQRPELKTEETEGHLYMSAALPHNTKTLFKGKVHSDGEAFKRIEALKPWMKTNGHSKMHVSIHNTKTGEVATHKVYADK